MLINKSRFLRGTLNTLFTLFKFCQSALSETQYQLSLVFKRKHYQQFLAKKTNTNDTIFFYFSDISGHATDYFPLESDILITTKFLAPAKIECPPEKALNSFRLEQRNRNEFRYIYQCKQLKGPVTIRYTTTHITARVYLSNAKLYFSSFW